MNRTAPIAKNHILISRALFNEGMRSVENQDYKKSVKKIAVGAILLFVTAAGWLLYTGGSPIFLLGEAIFLGALLFWLLVMLPCTKRNNKYKVMMRGRNTPPERTVVFYQEYLSVLADTGKETVIQYNSVTNWQETKNLYIINCRNNVSVLLDKKGFEIADFNTVRKELSKN